MNDSKVARFPIAKSGRDEEVAMVLQQLTEQNERGELLGFAYVAELIGPDTPLRYGNAGGICRGRIVGGLEILKLTLLREWETVGK